MGKLDEIPKEKIFATPESYFAELPSKIQSRITGGRRHAHAGFRRVWNLSLPLLLLVALSIYYLKDRPSGGPDAILTTVETSELVQYLDEGEIPTEDLIENTEFNPEDLEEIEKEIYNYGLDDYQMEENLNTL